MVEDDGSVDQEEPDRWTGCLIGVWHRMTIEEGRGFVRHVAHQPSGDRGQAVDPWRAKPVNRGAEGFARRQPARRFPGGEIPRDLL